VPAQTKAKFIDVHHHVVLPEYQTALIRSGAGDPSRPLRANKSPEQVLEAMQSFGIEAAVLNPLSVAGVHHGDNACANYLAESVNEALAVFVETAPRQLGFFAVLPLPDLDGALRQVAHAFDHLGADGVILLSNQNGKYVGDPAFEPLYAELDRRGAAVLIHPTRPSSVDALGLHLWPALVEYPAETTRVAANLVYNGVMQRYARIKWVLAHAGGCLPYLAFRMELMDESDDRSPSFHERHPEGFAPNVSKFYYDTAIAGSSPALRALYEVADPTRVMFGSDWPYISRAHVESQLHTLERADLVGAERLTQLAAANAKQLFPRFA
jgi:6-methylsalicylate decarboxylase